MRNAGISLGTQCLSVPVLLILNSCEKNNKINMVILSVNNAQAHHIPGKFLPLKVLAMIQDGRPDVDAAVWKAFAKSDTL